MAEQQQGNIQQNPKIAAVGLNMGSVLPQVKPGQLSWAVNAVLENFDGNSTTYQNEQANELCLVPPTGYRVIGRLNIIEDGLIIWWLVNPATGDSEIGTVSNCVYTKLINAKCLNHSVHHPILKSVYKKTNCGTEVYYTDSYNVRRYINLDQLPYSEILDCPPVTTGVVDCNKLSVQPNFNIPQIDITDVDSDGEITAGTYQFAVAYSNALAETYTSYYSITNPLPIFDPLKITQDFNYSVAKSIKIVLSNIDVTGYYDYINLAVIKTVNNITSVELVGTYEITARTKTLSYTGQGVQSKLTIADVFEKYPIYEVAGDLTVAQDILIWDQLTTDERLSYQSIANTIQLNWQTYRLVDTKPYAEELNAVYRRGYMRDEVYPYEIVFLLKNGKQTDGFHIPGRTSLPSDLVNIAGNDVIGEEADECSPTSQSLPRWRVYNTASFLGNSDEYAASQICNHGICIDNPCHEGPYQYGGMAYWESSDTYPCNPIYGALQNQPIRHHKFPDSLITHIHDNLGYVYPIGIRINVAQIYDAIQNSPLTTDQKSKVVGFKIVRGNRVNNKSVVAKGLMHNVGKYSRDDQTYYFPNYPYNDLGPDSYIQTKLSINDSGLNESTRLQAFTTDESKQRWVFHSPDTHFYQPPLGNIIKLETAEWGVSKGHFQMVQNHSTYKFPTAGAYLTSLIAAALVGFISSAALTGNIFNGTAAFAAYQTLLDIITTTSPKVNFTYQFNSIGEYKQYATIPNAGNKQRLLDIATYLSPGMIAVGDIHTINNFQRESSVYLKAAVTLPFPSEVPTIPPDHSRYAISDIHICDNPSTITERNVSSYYSSIKRNYLNQYGPLYSYETIDTGFQLLFPEKIQDLYSTPLRNIFGGDIFINRFAYKSKLPFFIDNRVSNGTSKVFPDQSDIEYSQLGNIAYPNFWFDTDSIEGTSMAIRDKNDKIIVDLGQVFGIASNNLDCDKRTSPLFYQKGKIYLFAYGIPYFYVESEVNVDLRQAYNGIEGDFFPHVSSDIPDQWLQETNTTIQYDNTYWYNKTYSKQNKENLFTHLPDNYIVEECIRVLPFRAIFSEQQKDFVNYRRNNWLIYRPLALFDFPQSYGSLTSLDGIENKQVLARFENKSLLYNALLTAPTNQQDVYLGQPFFDQRVPPLDFADTDLGFAGSQHKFLLKTEHGHISCDSRRGQVIVFGGQKAQNIAGTEETRQFFTTYLDFELKKAFPSYNVDNNYNGTGLTGVYDSKYGRLILTKTDFKPIGTGITLTDNRFFIGNTEVFLTDSRYFLNYSFTASYDFENNQWISMHTYVPDYYVGDTNYFYSGTSTGMWRHNTAIDKYNNFYGEIHPYILEYPYAYQYNDEILQNIKDYTKCLQYENWQSYIETDDIWFNKCILYNNQQSSGVLKLTKKPANNLSTYSSYPVYNTDSKEILFSKRDNFYLINTFWALNKSSQTPNWIPSTQNLSMFKEINQTNMDYSKRSYRKAPLRAKDLKIRLILDDRDDTKLLSTFQTAPTQTSYN